MLLNSWPSSYVRSFHQVRFIALLALIITHSISFVNSVTQVHLETLPYFGLMQFISAFGVMFIMVAAITFRMSFADNMYRDRLVAWPRTGIALYLLVLIGIDTAKNIWLYNDPTQIFQWDFLKTLLLAYMIIVALARIHVLLILIFSLSITTFAPSIRAFLRGFEIGPAHVTHHLIGWGEVHTQFLFWSLLTAILSLNFIWRLSAHRPFKLFLTSLVSLGVLAAYHLIAAHQPTLQQYIMMHNWWIHGLIGQSSDAWFYSGVAWLPTALNSFVAYHYGLKLRSLYERHSGVINLSVLILAAWAFFINKYVNSISAEKLIRIWDYPEFHKASLVTEFSKLALFINLFLALTYLNRRFPPTPMAQIVEPLSRSSFLVYLVCTSVTTIISPYAALRYGFIAGSTATILVTFVASLIVAFSADLLTRKTLKLTFSTSHNK